MTMPANPLASSHPLYQAVRSEALKTGPSFGVGGWLKTVAAWVLAQANPRQFIDTPEERQQIEKIAIDAFNALVGPNMPAIVLAGVDGFLTQMLDKVLTKLGTTIPAA